jgi:NAD(P)-dependent dehydrogenase (short-subunit alcohol dehydrogenase family)
MSNVVITGSASGIGAATRKLLEARGAHVVGVDIRDAEVEADLSATDGRQMALRRILEHCGNRLDGLVLCAGLGPVPGPPSLIVKVNYFGAVELLDGLKGALAAGDDPAAVVVCSNSATTVPGIPEDLVDLMLEGEEGGAGRRAEELDGSYAYAGSKLAVGRALRRRAPQWAGDGIRLNGVAPGATETPLLAQGLDDPLIGPAIRDFPIPLGRFGNVEEIAAAIGFLLGPDSRFCCGTILFADGGTDALVRPDSF